MKTKTWNTKLKSITVFMLALSLLAVNAEAAKRSGSKKSRGNTQQELTYFGTQPTPQDVNTESVKERYWSQGSDSDLGVVQNRLYTKKNKFEIQPFAGIMNSDPFLDVSGVGGLVGYHFSEYVSLNVLGYKTIVNDSNAMERLASDITTGAATAANLNRPIWFLGSELQYSPIYGKLSLSGAAILYYDFHLLGGAGLTNTQNGRYITPYIGVGQQVYLNQWSAIRLDYRHMYYNEEIVDRIRPATYGKVIGKRSNWTNSLTLGLSVLF